MLIRLRHCAAASAFLHSPISNPRKKAPTLTSFPSSLFSPLSLSSNRARFLNPVARTRSRDVEQGRTLEDFLETEAEVKEEKDEGGERGDFSSSSGSGDEDENDEGFDHASAYRGRQDEKDYDRDPEIAEILKSCFDDPKKAQSRVEERIRRKRNSILHTKTGSATPMKVRFNKFDFSNSYIWFEFYNALLPKDVNLICDAIRAWHIIGSLGGCNPMNMQLSQSAMDSKRPKYDAIQGANITPTTFYNIGDLEIQDNLARIWVDIGTSEPLLLDVLLNSLTCISSDFVGIKQVVFGGSEFENWNENMTTEDAVYSTHKI